MPLIASDDCSIFYEATGDGPPLLMLMGFGLDRGSWMMQVPHFRKRFRCLLVDNRGVGSSGAPPGPYRMAQMAADARAVLDAEGVERAHVLGLSMGGMMAQHLALESPERIDRLVLACTTASMGVHGEALAVQAEQLLGLPLGWRERPVEVAFDLVQFGHFMADVIFSPEFLAAGGDMLKQMMAMFVERLPPPRVLVAQLAAILGHDVTARLAGIRAPTLVFGGAEDTLIPAEHSASLAAGIPGARLTLAPGGSHAINVERPADFNRAVMSFLEAA